MTRSLYATLGLAAMLLIAIAPAFVGSGGLVSDVPVATPDATPTADADQRAVEDLAAWPVAATR